MLESTASINAMISGRSARVCKMVNRGTCPSPIASRTGGMVGSSVVTDTLGHEHREPSAPGKQSGVHAIGFLPKGATKIVVLAPVATARTASGASCFGWVRDFAVPIQMAAPAAPHRANSPDITREAQEHTPLRAAIDVRDAAPELSVNFESNRLQDGRRPDR